MHHGSKWFLVVALLLTMCATAGAEGDTIKAELAQVEQMRTVLREKGVWGFFEAVAAQGWPTPWIRSDYWVERQADTPKGKIELERAKRAWGLDLAKALDAESLRVIKPADSAERERQATRLLDAAAWLRRSRGYGNLLLAARTENLAHVPLGYLIADLNYPMSKIDALRRQLRTSEEDLDLRLVVLKEESPCPIEISREGGAEKTSERLYLTWNRGYHDMATWSQSRGRRPAGDKANRRLLPDEYSIFSDDEISTPPFTISNKWNQKQHKSFCVNGMFHDRESLDALYLFRQKVGRFPTQPPSWFGPNEKMYTALQAAFVTAWEPFESEYGPIGSTAARVLEKIKANLFMDRDTMQYVDSIAGKKN